jgi:F-type H+-transporting ATPase subunit delta
MNESIISVRYTKAIFSLANEKGILDVVKNDIELIFTLMNESEGLMQVFQNPVLKPSKKREIVKEIFGTTFHQITIAFINLLIDNRREVYLHSISRNFLTKYKHFKGIESGVFTTAILVDEKMLANVRTLVQNALKTQVELINHVDEKILGGFVLRVGDKQFDASVQSNFNKIRRKLLNTTVN